MHRIVGAYWTPRVNMVEIVCDVHPNRSFAVRSDRWKILCPECKRRGNLGALRERYRLDSTVD